MRSAPAGGPRARRGPARGGDQRHAAAHRPVAGRLGSHRGRPRRERHRDRLRRRRHGRTASVGRPAIKATGRTVDRISGADRYDTAALVAQKVGNPTAILLATGRDFPDALAGGTAAAKVGGILLLTNGSTMPDASAQYLAEHATAPVYALGGPAAGAAPSATALVGTDRYDTAVKVAKAFFTAPSGVSVASGVVFADALSGGADAAAQGWPLLITRPAAFPQVASQYVTATPTIVHADVYGGTGAVQANVATALAGCLHG